MNFIRVIGAICLCFVIGFSFYFWIAELNTAYVPLGGAAVDTGFYSDSSTIGPEMSGLAASTSGATSGSSVSSSSANSAIVSGRSIFGILGDLLDFVPNLMSHVTGYFGLNPFYGQAAGWFFQISFAITLAYLLLIGRQVVTP